jgi:hypothetical protein
MKGLRHRDEFMIMNSFGRHDVVSARDHEYASCGTAPGLGFMILNNFRGAT